MTDREPLKKGELVYWAGSPKKPLGIVVEDERINGVKVYWQDDQEVVFSVSRSCIRVEDD